MNYLADQARSTFGKIVNLVKNPITEMVIAAIIDLSRNYLFSVINQFIGNQLIYLIIQVSIVVLPWVMLGHGALRYPEKINKVHFNTEHTTSSLLTAHKNLNLFNLLIAISLVIKLLLIC